MSNLILASGSPRRAVLLQQVGLSFVVEPQEIDEAICASEDPVSYVSRMSLSKAESASLQRHETVLAADTVVVKDDKVLGKPKDRDDARRMLALLSGTDHRVLTSVSVKSHERVESLLVETIVWFREISEIEQSRYWETGEPLDKAGGYGIQGIGAVFVEKLAGGYSNVVGLPLMEVAQLLKTFGFDCLKQN